MDFQTIVVGGGAMGAATAYHLAGDGQAVLLIEQFDIGHNRGSSHGQSRIIRYSYEHPVYIRLARHAYRLWRQLGEEAGQALITTTGGLDLGWPGNSDFKDCIESLCREGIAHEILDSREISRRFPQFRITPEVSGLWQGDAGVLRPDRCVPCLVDRAQAHGATVMTGTPVESIESDGATVTVVSGDARYRASSAVIACGSWAERVCAWLGVELSLKVTLEQYAYFKTARAECFLPPDFPVFINYAADRMPYIYGFPVLEQAGIKVAEHHGGEVTCPDSRSFAPDPVRLKRLIERTNQLLPDAGQEIIAAETCLYTTTADKHFIIDRAPGFANVFIAGGFSGHGFKFAIAVGRIMADLVTSGATDYDIGQFALSRLQSGEATRLC